MDVKRLALANEATPEMRKPTVMIADDHTMIVEALHKLLEPHYQIVATVPEGRRLLETAPALRPDIVLIDIGMPLLNVLAAGQQLKKILPRTKLIYLTMNQDGDVASAALRNGASGYLLKTSAVSELLCAIDEALQGGTYVAPQIKRLLTDSSIRSPKPEVARKLTARQAEILQLLAEGRLMKEVGAVLGLTPRNVASHKYRMMEVIGAKTNAELIQFAIKNHFVSC